MRKGAKILKSGSIIIAILLVFLAVVMVLVSLFRRGIEFGIQTIGYILIAVGAAFFCYKFMIQPAWHHYHNCGDELFQKIDEQERYLENGHSYYIRCIQVIKLFYSDGGKIDELVQNKEVERLYRRKDFLLKRKSLFDDSYSYLNSLVISIMATCIMNIAIDQRDYFIVGNLILAFMALSFILCFKFREKGSLGSYQYLIIEYELKLLEEKIEKLAGKLNITDWEYDLLCTQTTVVDLLKKLKKRKLKKKNTKRKLKNRKCKRKRREIEESILLVESLNMLVEDYSNTWIREIYIEGHKAYLLYNENGSENGYEGKLNLKTDDYNTLYEVIDKYGWYIKYGRLIEPNSLKKPADTE